MAPLKIHRVWPLLPRKAIAQQVAAGALRSTIADVVSFDDLPSAIEHNRTGHAPGKIVVDFTF
ncbi:zinc-binding dehydrogenase (plasmid) [Rhizobium sp. RCAM05350]|nr:zinc-binding dehydrogenase [Rhizobium sp. RCAM05350]